MLVKLQVHIKWYWQCCGCGIIYNTCSSGKGEKVCHNTGGKVLDKDSTCCVSNPSLPLLTMLFSFSVSPEEDAPEGFPL